MTEEQKDNNELEGSKKIEATLVSEPEADQESDEFERQLQQTLKDTEEAVLNDQKLGLSPNEVKSWLSARAIIDDFRPVPWFIWRLSNFVFSKSGATAELQEGLVFGLRRLMFAIASDAVLGKGEKINNVRRALQSVSPDVIAAVTVIHAVCRRLGKKAHERIWRPILEDALLRARIGYDVGSNEPSFGAGRGMLAGFAGRCGLVILIANGEEEQARSALELLATGAEIREVGKSVYECDPLQVSAMTLSAAGCGRDAAFGTVSFALAKEDLSLESPEQLKWLAAFTITENLRCGTADEVTEEIWQVLGIEAAEREGLAKLAKQTIRRGHGWNWIV